MVKPERGQYKKVPFPLGWMGRRHTEPVVWNNVLRLKEDKENSLNFLSGGRGKHPTEPVVLGTVFMPKRGYFQFPLGWRGRVLRSP